MVDFKKLSVCIQEFLSRLPCDESTGFLRDTLYLSLLELHKHYVKVKDRLSSSLRQLNGTLTAVSNHERLAFDKYERRWHGCEEQGSEETKTEGFLAALQGDIAKLKATVHSGNFHEGQLPLSFFHGLASSNKDSDNRFVYSCT